MIHSQDTELHYVISYFDSFYFSFFHKVFPTISIVNHLLHSSIAIRDWNRG